MRRTRVKAAYIVLLDVPHDAYKLLAVHAPYGGALFRSLESWDLCWNLIPLIFVKTPRKRRDVELEKKLDDESVKKTARVPKEEHDTVLSMPTGIVEEAKGYICRASSSMDFFADNQAPRKDLAVLELSFKD
nr:hypothetical protein [Tanacetum cinerariifolium]